MQNPSSRSLPSFGDPSLSNRYRLIRELGQGGMATVYLAEDTKYDRQVAIKILLPEMAVAIGTDRFLREIEIAARLTHPHILPLHDSGSAGDRLFYVMPYIEGQSLRARLDQERRLSLEEALRLTREIAGALGYAHHQGVVHRDIKPENILLSDGIALVADFGIARVASALGGGSNTTAATTVGAVVGTPQYMAPEQATGDTVDGRADLYSLACVLFEMLAGRPPFVGPDLQSLIHQHMNAQPPPVQDLRADVPPGVAHALSRGLAKLPVDRHASAARFTEALTVAAEMATPTPPAPDEALSPSNLPRLRTHFIGRERELAECARLFGETRLLTLTGIGGCGKTRLALKLAADLRESFPDGVWFVDLAPITDPERVAPTAARTVGAREARDKSALQSLEEHAKGSRMLVVLDNAEHVLIAATEVVEALLEGSGEAKIIVTSREILGVEGERPFGVRSLSVPRRDGSDRATIAASESVRLFVDRARVVAPEFDLTDGNAPVVAEIVRRLDGIPLALELAAARAKILSVEQIREKLDDRFRLLKGGSRALPRHQTLRAAIEWSYDHLDDEERHLFRLLSVFGGGWTLEAATAVAGEDADEFEVMDLLSRLVDKSLVTPERGEGWTRYAMLETVRQYAQERLNETDEGDVARSRHLGFYLTLAEEARLHMVGPGSADWAALLDRELENLLLAHEECARHGADRDLRLVCALSIYFGNRGNYRLGRRVTRDAVGRVQADAHQELWGKAQARLGVYEYRLGLYEPAARSLEAGLAALRDTGGKEEIAFALNWLAHAVTALGEISRARGYLEQSVALARESGNRGTLATCLNGLAELCRYDGDVVGSVQLYEETITVAREVGNSRLIAINLLNLSRSLLTLGDAARALPLIREAHEIFEDAGLPAVLGSLADVAAGLAGTQGKWTQAARLLGVSEGLNERAGSPREPVDEAFVIPIRSRAQAELGEEGYAAAHAAGWDLGAEGVFAGSREVLEVEE